MKMVALTWELSGDGGNIVNNYITGGFTSFSFLTLSNFYTSLYGNRLDIISSGKEIE